LLLDRLPIKLWYPWITSCEHFYDVKTRSNRIGMQSRRPQISNLLQCVLKRNLNNLLLMHYLRDRNTPELLHLKTSVMLKPNVTESECGRVGLNHIVY